MTEAKIEELLQLVRRELGARSAAIAAPGERPEASDARLVRSLPGGRAIVVDLAEPTSDRADADARLDLLIASFDALFEEPRTSSRPPPSDALHDALAALAEESGAREVVIVDAHSPVVWSTSAPIAENGGEAFEPRPPEDGWPVSASAQRAVEIIRALPAMETLPRGGHLHHHEVGEGFGMLARSFAGIYVLVLAYEGELDELRAQRAIAHALAAIERLVVALPPLEPPPGIAGVVAMRRPRRR